MCEFCIQHGEGKKWYLQARNYSTELINEERMRYVFDFAGGIEEWATIWAGEMDRAAAEGPASKAEYVAQRTAEFKRTHYGQIVPLEDIYRILDMMVSIVRLPCVCRSALWGRYDARYCFGVTGGLPNLRDFFDLYPDFSTDHETLTAGQAKDAFRRHDEDGLVHSVWTFITPFIGVVCNCTSKDCLPLVWRLRQGLPLFFKAEYVAAIDPESCTGCRDCAKVCNFGAIGYSASLERCFVHPFQCYGCGVCRAVCPSEAIALGDRNTVPMLAREW